MSKWKKTILLGLALVLSVGACACNSEKSKGTAEIWTALSDAKIMADKDYKDMMSQKQLSISMAKNETESGQILITAASDIKNYTVAVSDLYCGSEIIKSTDIEIFNQKYIEVTQSSKNMDTPLGFYPDALLPFNKAVEYRENRIKKGSNQGIWLQVTTKEDTKAGTYTGTAEITIDGAKKDVRVEVTVWDVTIPTAVHARSLFYTKPRFYAMAEKDPTDDLMVKYVDSLLDFRLSPLYLPYFGSVDTANANIDEYVSQIVKYAKDERLTYYQIPYTAYYDASWQKRIDEKSLTDYMVAIAEASIKENVDLFPKAGLYLSNLIDEPEQNGTVGEIGIHADAIKRCKAAAIEKLALLPDHELKDSLAQSINDIPHILTNRYIPGQENNVDIWCPTLDKFHTRDNRALYEGEKEVWWYGCIDPQAPYATYYIDDLSPSPRVMSWMQKDYDIAGNLYWAVDLYGDRFDITKKINPYTDAPDRAAWAETNVANGDGFLFYPGSYYGLDSPVASVRLHSIRDGLEDYEILYQIEELYAQNGKSCDELLDLVYHTLFEGTKVKANAEGVLAARKKAVEILLLAQKGTFIDGVRFAADKAIVSAFNKDGKEITINGNKFDGSATVMLNQSSNKLTLVCDGENFEITLCGKVQNQDFAVADVSSVSTENGAVTKEDGKAKISLGDADDGSRQRFTLGGDILKNVNKNTSLVIELYVDKTAANAENMRLEVLIEGSENQVYHSYETIKLTEGKNVITLDCLYYMKWANIGRIKNLHFNIGEQGGEARTVYIGTVTVYENG